MAGQPTPSLTYPLRNTGMKKTSWFCSTSQGLPTWSCCRSSPLTPQQKCIRGCATCTQNKAAPLKNKSCEQYPRSLEILYLPNSNRKIHHAWLRRICALERIPNHEDCRSAMRYMACAPSPEAMPTVPWAVTEVILPSTPADCQGPKVSPSTGRLQCLRSAQFKR